MSGPCVWWRASRYLREPAPVKVVGETAQSIKVEFDGMRNGDKYTRTTRKSSAGEVYVKTWAEARDVILNIERRNADAYRARAIESDARVKYLEQLSDPTAGGAS